MDTSRCLIRITWSDYKIQTSDEQFWTLYWTVFGSLFCWTWRNGDGFWQCHSSLHLIGLAKRSHLYSVSGDLNLSFQLDYLWNIFADGSSPAVNPFLVLPKPLLNLKMQLNAWKSYDELWNYNFMSILIYGQVIIYLCDK